jgi:membrane dipeptidase
MYIVDMHCDSLLTVSGESGLINCYNLSHKYPQLQFFAEFCMKGNEDAYTRRRRLLHMLDIYLYECQRLGISKIKSVKDLNDAVVSGQNAALLSLEGGGGIFENSDELNTLFGAGLLVMGMAWDDNELSSSAVTECDTGLTEEGKALCKRAEELGIILDVSHLSDKAFYDTMKCYQAPVLATHSNFRDVCNSKRNLTRDMALKIAERGGVIGLNIYPPLLNESGTATFDDIYRHLDYGLELVGENHIGFGFDIDGTSGKYPEGISVDYSIHEQVIDKLLSRYPESTVEKIAGTNVIEFLQNNIMF